MIVAITVLLGFWVHPLGDRGDDFLFLFREREGPRARRILAIAGIPTFPQAIDVAMMQPENGIAGGPGNAAHVLSVADQNVHHAVQAKIELHTEPLMNPAGRL